MNDAREEARQFSMVRIAFGVTMLVLPGLVGRIWIGDAAGNRGVKAIIRGFGVRDVFVGMSIIDALDEDRQVSRLLQLGVACDAADALLALTGGRDVGLVRRLMILVLAGGAAAQGMRLATATQAQGA
ncbi:MAG TPA: hypothetical protein VGA13_02050 [Acidimicrobiales bacterium]|jgi:hypothetical protein